MERQNRTLPNKFRFSELDIHLPIPVHHYIHIYPYGFTRVDMGVELQSTGLGDRGTVLERWGGGLEVQGWRFGGVDVGLERWVWGLVDGEVFRGAGITERQNPSGSPSARKSEPGRRARLHQGPDNLLTDILTPVTQLPNSGNLGTKWILGRLYGG